MVRRRQVVAVAGQDDEQGAVIILLALFIVTLLVMVALVIDLGNARQTRRQAQNAADAAALAAAIVVAQQLEDPDYARAVADAKRYVFSNYGDVVWNGCTDADNLGNTPDPGNECISFNLRSRRVRVRIPTRSVATFFGSVAGMNDVNVSASAIAQIHWPTAAPCGLCVLRLGQDEALHLRGDGAPDGSLTVSGNGVVVNSSDSEAVVAENDTYLEADPPFGVAVVGGSVGDIRPPAQPLAAAIPDPLSGTPAPPPWFGSANDRVFRDVPGATLSPGNYHDIDLIGDTTLTLGAGIYVITGEVNVESTAHLVGNGVTLYFTCGGNGIPVPCIGGENDRGRFANVDGTVLLTAPSLGTYKGMALFYDRNNAVGLTVTPSFNITGTIYLASGALEFEGDQDTSLRSMVVADTVLTGGEGHLTLDYDASQNAEIRQIPTLFR
jgi:Flp pilus assembly protein TadG